MRVPGRAVVPTNGDGVAGMELVIFWKRQADFLLAQEHTARREAERRGREGDREGREEGGGEKGRGRK